MALEGGFMVHIPYVGSRVGYGRWPRFYGSLGPSGSGVANLRALPRENRRTSLGSLDLATEA